MRSPNRTVKLGDRVYYADNGRDDQGVIINITLEEFPFTVKWDRSKNTDETVDQFKGSQLGFVTEDEQE